jgi:hypothetical protein
MSKKYGDLKQYLETPASPEETSQAAPNSSAVAPVKDPLKPVGLGPRRRLRGRELQLELERRGAPGDLARLAARHGLDYVYRDREVVPGGVPATGIPLRELLYGQGLDLNGLD